MFLVRFPRRQQTAIPGVFVTHHKRHWLIVDVPKDPIDNKSACVDSDYGLAPNRHIFEPMMALFTFISLCDHNALRQIGHESKTKTQYGHDDVDFLQNTRNRHLTVCRWGLSNFKYHISSAFGTATYIMMTSSNRNIFRVTGPLCGEFTCPRWVPLQRPVTRSFDVFFDLRLNKRLIKQSWCWWFETPSCLLWCHCNDRVMNHRVL